MATANVDGIRKRSSVTTVIDNNSPITSTPIQTEAANGRKIDMEHPGGSAHPPLLQAGRIIALVLYFMGSCISMNLTQFVGAPVYFYDKDWYYAWMAITKQHFGLLLVTLQQWWSPTTVRVSGDESVRGQLRQASDGRLECDFPERMVLISNHVLYTDWLYLWWAAYTARMHGHIIIILKESLKYVPVLGWGMQFFSFVFLSRNWTKDKQRFSHRIDKLKRKGKDGAYSPMWLLIFPEGTNLSKNARVKSEAWAKKQNIPDLRHAILPRSTGLHFCLTELDNTVEWVYDCTLAYEGTPRSQYGQDIYTLRAIYLQGRAPKSVNMYWRRFLVRDIPTEPTAFESWVLERWREKDALLEYFHQHNRFPADDDSIVEYRLVPNGAGVTKPVPVTSYVETMLRPGSRVEFLQMFVPILAVGLILHLVKRLWRWALVTLAIRS